MFFIGIFKCHKIVPERIYPATLVNCPITRKVMSLGNITIVSFFSPLMCIPVGVLICIQANVQYCV